MRYLRRGGGYFINVGGSDLIVSGEVGIEQADDIARVVPGGVQLGDEVAERVGPIWGFDENGSMANMWQRTAQEGLWIMGGALMEARFHSRFLAVQIKAELEGLV